MCRVAYFITVWVEQTQESGRDLAMWMAVCNLFPVKDFGKVGIAVRAAWNLQTQITQGQRNLKSDAASSEDGAILAVHRRSRMTIVCRQEANMIGENHQAGRKLEASESIYPLQSKDSIKAENNKRERRINELQMVWFEPYL